MVVVSTSPPTSAIPGVYGQVVSQPKSVGLIPSDIVATVFQSSRGPANTPLYFETMQDFVRTFGPITLNPTDQTKVLDGYIAAEVIGSQGVQRKYGVRVLNSLGATAYITLSAPGGAMLTLHAASPGTWANGSIVVTTSAGPTTSTFNLTAQNTATGEADLIVGIPWNDMNAAMRQINGASTLLTATLPVIDAANFAPTVVTIPQLAAPSGFSVVQGATTGGTLASGTTYYYKISAIDAAGETLPSSEVSFTPATGATNVGTATWTAVPNATGYRIYRSTVSGTYGASSLLTIIGSGATVTYTDTGSATITGTPALVNTSAGTIPAGAYRVVTTFTNAAGETISSPESALATLSNLGTLQITQSSPTTGAVGMKVYITPVGGASGTEVFAGQNTAGFTLTLTAPWTVSTVVPPLVNGATSATAAYVGASPTLATTTFPLTGILAGSGAATGNDGITTSAALYVGGVGVGPAATPNTGIYAFSGMVPHANILVPAGIASTDTTQWATLAQFGLDNDMLVIVSLPQGTQFASALTTMATPTVTGIANTLQGDFLKVAYSWADMYEGDLFNANYRVPATYYNAGATAAQPANTAASNKPLYNIVGPEYVVVRSQQEQAIAANLNILAPTLSRTVNGLPAWGFLTDKMLSGRGCYEVRMQSLIFEDFAVLGADYVGTPNTPQLRAEVQALYAARLAFYADQGLIPSNPAGLLPQTATPPPSTSKTSTKTGVTPQLSVAQTQNTQVYYSVVCDDSNNLVNGVPTANLIVDVQVQLAPNVEKIVLRTQIGPTVQVTLTQQAA